MGMFKSPKIPERSSPVVRTQADLAQEASNDYTKRFRARQQTLLSDTASASSGSDNAAGQKKNLLGE